jgi:hypothetical protein
MLGLALCNSVRIDMDPKGLPPVPKRLSLPRHSVQPMLSLLFSSQILLLERTPDLNLTSRRFRKLIWIKRQGLLASCGRNHPQNDIFGYYNAPRLAKAVQAN